MKTEYTQVNNLSHRSINNKSITEDSDIVYIKQFYNFHRSSILIDEFMLINNNFQVFISVILCVMSFIGTLLHIKILIRRYFRKKPLPHHIFLQTLFDIGHLINILFIHTIIITVNHKTSTTIDLVCPISAFFFSIASFGFISFICLGAFHRYMYFCKKYSQYRYTKYRLLAHRILLITTLSWLIFNFPKINFHVIF